MKVNNLDKESVKVGRFLAVKKAKSKATYHKYKTALSNFFECIDKNPDEYIVDIRRLENDEKYDKIDEYKEDIEKFYFCLVEQNKSKLTRNDYLSIVKGLLEKFDIELPTAFWKSLKEKSPRPITEEVPFTTEIVERILSECDTKMSAFILILESSGMRPDELLQVTLKDVEFDDNGPTCIYIENNEKNGKHVKNRISRHTFISSEATRYLKEWLLIRDEFLVKTATKFNKTTGLTTRDGKRIQKSLDDNRVFPFSYETAVDVWNRILRDVGLDEIDENTRRHKYRMYGLRKYFRRNFVRSASGKTRDACEQLMGHEGYLNGAYHKMTKEELRKEYVKAEEYLLIRDRPMLKPEAKQQIDGLKMMVHEMKQNEMYREKAHQKELQDMQEQFNKQLQNIQQQFANITGPM